MMMRKLSSQLFICFYLLMTGFYTPLAAQNFVPNPSFEVQDSCPQVSEIEIAIPWNSPTYGSPDLFNNTCPSQNGSSFSGIGCSGIYTYSTFPDNREYLQVRLSSPLVAGTSYDVTFFCKRLTYFSLAVDRIGAYLSTTEYDLMSTAPLTQLTPQIENQSGNVLNGTGYNLISGTFLASGGEEYMIIGNFRDDAGTITEDVELNGNLKSYYYIDDVSIYEYGTGVPELKKGASLTIYPNPSTGSVNLEVLNSEPGAGLSYDITDINGKVVRRDSYGSDIRRILDLSALNNGMYMMRLYSGDQVIAYKNLMLR